MADLTMSNSTLSMYHTCPPGLNGTSCETATCDSPFTAPARRAPKRPTDKRCAQCADGFGGLNCNVCQQPTACESVRAKLGVGNTNTASSRGSGLAGAIVRNETLTCSMQPRAVTTSYVDCKVDSPLISALIPGDISYMGIKVAQPDAFDSSGLASWPSTAGTSYSAAFLDGIEQFRCQSSQCTSSNVTSSMDPTSKLGADNWKCGELQCECLPGSTICTGNGVLDLTAIIDGLTGPLEMPCDYLPDGAPPGQSKCAFKSPVLSDFFGPDGLPLTQCSFGSCLAQSDLENSWAVDHVAQDAKAASRLSGGVIAGLVVLILIIKALLTVLFVSWYMRRKAAKKARHEDTAAVGVSWNRVNYHLPSARPAWIPAFISTKSRRASENNGGNRSAVAVEGTGFEVLKLEGLGDHTVIAGLPSGQTVEESSGHILKDVRGTCEPGTFTAILGPSGSGKTTLLDVLSGRQKSGKLDGEVRFVDRDGNLVQASADRRLVAFVDQEDHLPALSTPREALAFACRLCNAENVPILEQNAIVDGALNALHLDFVADNRIGDSQRRGLSGGEKRRVSIGMAMVARPKILLLDEPLSGLDATAARLVVSSLRKLAAGPNGTTIIMTVHQPSSEIFYLADHILVLSSGRFMYEGSPTESIEWCQKHGQDVRPGFNVAELLLDMAYNPGMIRRPSEEPGDALSPDTTTKPSSLASRAPLNPGGEEPLPSILGGSNIAKQQKPATVFYTQFSALLHRHYKTAQRDYSGPLAHNLGSLVLGLMVGGSFFQVNLSVGGFQNRVGSIYFTLILLSFVAMSACTVMARARPLMLRERANAYYNPYSWMASHLAYDLIVLRITPTIILAEVVYWMVGLKNKAEYHLLFLLMMLVYSITMALFNMSLAVMLEDLSVTILLCGLFILFNIAFGGFLLNLNTMPKVLRWLKWLAPLHYALEAVASRELRGLMLVDNLGGGKVEITTPVSVFEPSLFGFEDAYYQDLLWLSLGFLLPHALFLFAGAYFSLRERR